MSGPVNNKEVADQISKLYELHQSGALTKAEFENAKRRLLGEKPPLMVAQPPPGYSTPVQESRPGRFAGWKRTLVLILILAISAAVIDTVVTDTEPDTESEANPTERSVPQSAQITLTSGDGSGEDTTEYLDGTIRVIVTIPDSNHWEATEQGCTGAGDGVAGDLHSGQLASVSPIDSTTSTNVAFLQGGVMFDDGSCQFAFDADMFDSSQYDITVWKSSTVCKREEMLDDGNGGLLAEVVATDTQLSCKIPSEVT